MGEGQIDLKAYFAAFRQLCPGVPVHIETILGLQPRVPVSHPEFWKAWPAMPADRFAHFLALAKHGTPRPTFQAPAGEDRKAAEQAYQKGEIERSLTYCRNVLGLGLSADTPTTERETTGRTETLGPQDDACHRCGPRSEPRTILELEQIVEGLPRVGGRGRAGLPLDADGRVEQLARVPHVL